MATIDFGNVTCKLQGVDNMDVLYEIANRLSYTTGGFGAMSCLIRKRK